MEMARPRYRASSGGRPGLPTPPSPTPRSAVTRTAIGSYVSYGAGDILYASAARPRTRRSCSQPVFVDDGAALPCASVRTTVGATLGAMAKRSRAHRARAACRDRFARSWRLQMGALFPHLAPRDPPYRLVPAWGLGPAARPMARQRSRTHMLSYDRSFTVSVRLSIVDPGALAIGASAALSASGVAAAPFARTRSGSVPWAAARGNHASMVSVLGPIAPASARASLRISFRGPLFGYCVASGDLTSRSTTTSGASPCAILRAGQDLQHLPHRMRASTGGTSTEVSACRADRRFRGIRACLRPTGILFTVPIEDADAP